ncbi:MAG: hypothetical protein ACJAYJ_003715 [Saprospiraceae bacterium]|jgi:hypothetical protein
MSNDFEKIIAHPQESYLPCRRQGELCFEAQKPYDFLTSQILQNVLHRVIVVSNK